MTFCLGDFFDKAELNSEEVTALEDIRWAGMTNNFIVGNHEMGSVNHEYSSARLFSLLDTGCVEIEPNMVELGGIELCILPYILETERKPLSEYFPPRTNLKRVILSHNDIKGMQMGAFISQEGFSIEEIEENCDLFINGHLHNGAKISDKIINIGNLTGQNFSEDASIYDHCAFILDTETLKIEVYENPYAFNFYKLDAIKQKIDFNRLKENSVVTLRCYQKDAEEYKEKVSACNNIVESRITIELFNNRIDTEESYEDLSVDHIQRFKQYILEQLGTSDIVQYELEEVCK